MILLHKKSYSRQGIGISRCLVVDTKELEINSKVILQNKQILSQNIREE